LVTIDGQSGRFTIKSVGLPTAFSINGTNGGSVKLDNLLFSGFTGGPIIKLESGATNFRMGYVTGDANVKFYDNSLAAANNSDATVPLLLAQNAGVLNFFAVVPLDAEDIKTKLRFIDTTNATSQDFLSDNNLTNVSSVKTHALKDGAGADPSGGTKIVIEGILPVGLAAANKFQAVLINNAGKNVSLVNLNPNPWPYLDTDADSLVDLVDPNPTVNTNNFEDFYKFFSCTGTDCTICSDGTKVVSCNSTLTADQTAAPAARTSSSGCSLVEQNSENIPFGIVTMAALCLGILAGRRLRLNGMKK